MTKTTALAILLAAALGVSVGMQLGMQAPAAPSDGEAQQLEAIHQTLIQMVARLEPRPSQPAGLPGLPSREAAAEDQPVEPSRSLANGQSELEGLREELRAFVKELSALREPESVSAPIREEAPRPTDLGAVRAVRTGLPSGLVNAGPELFGLSPAQVYRRFGAPTSVGQGARGRVLWNYDDPAFPSPFVVTFVDGYLVWLQSSAD